MVFEDMVWWFGEVGRGIIIVVVLRRYHYLSCGLSLDLVRWS